jgi:hypothetical protein
VFKPFILPGEFLSAPFIYSPLEFFGSGREGPGVVCGGCRRPGRPPSSLHGGIHGVRQQAIADPGKAKNSNATDRKTFSDPFAVAAGWRSFAARKGAALRLKKDRLKATQGAPMKQTLLQETSPVYSLELDRGETTHESVDAIVDYFKRRIEAHRCARLIAVFDHAAHTRSLPEGELGSAIRAAKNIIFCFGITLPEPRALALRPRSIGIAETDEGFVISFLEAPMPLANAAMEDWTNGLRNRPSPTG